MTSLFYPLYTPVRKKSLYDGFLGFFLCVCRHQSNDLKVDEIKRNMLDAEKAQSKATENSETAFQDRDKAKDQIEDVKYENTKYSRDDLSTPCCLQRYMFVLSFFRFKSKWMTLSLS